MLEVGGDGGRESTSMFIPSLGSVSFAGVPSSPSPSFDTSLFRGGMLKDLGRYAIERSRKLAC